MSTAKSNQWLDATLESVLAAKPIENISLTQPDITAEAAYDLQHQLIARLQTHGGWGDIYGYKAALTAQAAQQAMGIDEPIIGALFQLGAKSTDAQIAVHADRPILLETELGFTLSQAITEPVDLATVLHPGGDGRGLTALAAPPLPPPSCAAQPTHSPAAPTPRRPRSVARRRRSSRAAAGRGPLPRPRSGGRAAVRAERGLSQ